MGNSDEKMYVVKAESFGFIRINVSVIFILVD